MRFYHVWKSASLKRPADKETEAQEADSEARARVTAMARCLLKAWHSVTAKCAVEFVNEGEQHMSVVLFLIFGLVVGLIARAVMPGSHENGAHRNDVAGCRGLLRRRLSSKFVH